MVHVLAQQRQLVDLCREHGGTQAIEAMTITRTRAAKGLERMLGPAFKAAGGRVYMVPVQDVLSGFCLDPTDSAASACYVTVFVMPLYVPARVLSLSGGWRIGGGTRAWSFDDALDGERLSALAREEGIAFLTRFSKPERLTHLARYLTRERDPVVLQMSFCSQLWIGDIDAARQSAVDLRALLNPATPWQADMAARVDRLLEMAAVSPEKVTELLRGWKEQTVDALQLRPFL